jgi:hypothetical protein
MESSSVYPEETLPPNILAKAIRHGNEIGWRREDVREALAAAEARQLAAIGGQVQFLLDGGTCELYWQSYDSSARRDGELWPVYVERSHREVENSLSRIPPSESLVKEGLDNFEFLREKAASGLNLQKYLRFVCYFAAQDTK